MQARYEETDEDVRRRRERAQNERAGWIGTAIGLLLGAVALVLLFVSS